MSSQPNGEVAATAGGGKAQAAAAEIAVTVNGARTIAGTDKREPFSENTNTVLVFPKGAVIRLASMVAAGQLLFLTNEKTKKEVVCQVTKSRNEASVGGYVELEFTEPAAGFWGMRFAGAAPVAPASSAAESAMPSATPSPVLDSLKEKLTEAKSKAPSAPVLETAKAVENQPASASGARPGRPADVNPAQSTSGVPAKPTLSEFLTQGAAGPILKITEKAKTEVSEPQPDTSAQEPKELVADLQHQLSTKLFTPTPARQGAPPAAVPASKASQPAQASAQRESLSSLLIKSPTQENPAPGTSTFDFGSDEVKIPSWLEPLARNSGSGAPAQLTASRDSFESSSKLLEGDDGAAKQAETPVLNLDSQDVPKLASFPADGSEAHAEVQPPAFALSSEGPAPNFGSSLALDRNSSGAEAVTKRSNKVLILVLLAAGLLLAAGAWYWHSNQVKDVSASGASTEKADFAPPVTSTPSTNATLSADSNRSVVDPQSKGIDSKGTTATANGYSKPSTNTNNVEIPAQPPNQTARKPLLGGVRLAAPVVSRRTSASDGTSYAEPAIQGNASAGMDSGNLNMLAGKNNQPAAPVAPVPIGGDVKQAVLLSSVAPVYPQLARNQRLSGDVQIDALIDDNGRVSATKVLSGPALLYQSAIDAVRLWKYQPASLNGKPVAMHLTVTVHFKLQ
jgi:TonB family protein